MSTGYYDLAADFKCEAVAECTLTSDIKPIIRMVNIHSTDEYTSIALEPDKYIDSRALLFEYGVRKYLRLYKINNSLKYNLLTDDNNLNTTIYRYQLNYS